MSYFLKKKSVAHWLLAVLLTAFSSLQKYTGVHRNIRQVSVCFCIYCVKSSLQVVRLVGAIASVFVKIPAWCPLPADARNLITGETIGSVALRALMLERKF